MQVLNIHKRVLQVQKQEVSVLFNTLATRNDKIWPHEKWPAMRFKNGLKENEHGGHGPIKYTIVKYLPPECIEFKFNSPKGFNGVHRLDITALGDNKTEIKHTIDMQANGFGIITWSTAVKWLHNALLTDLMDKVENHFISTPKHTNWNLWVRFLRKLLK